MHQTGHASPVCGSEVITSGGQWVVVWARPRDLGWGRYPSAGRHLTAPCASYFLLFTSLLSRFAHLWAGPLLSVIWFSSYVWGGARGEEAGRWEGAGRRSSICVDGKPSLKLAL